MVYRIPTLDVPADEPFRNDALERHPTIEFLTRLIERAGGQFVLARSASRPWARFESETEQKPRETPQDGLDWLGRILSATSHGDLLLVSDRFRMSAYGLTDGKQRWAQNLCTRKENLWRWPKFIVCGGAGVLRKDIAVGHLVIPVSAVRDEGVSYHYLPAAREVECSPQVVEKIEEKLKEFGIDYIKARTWTTDSFYRETEKKIELRKSEGCVTVEMEAAAFFAVAKFRDVELGQILYGGDDLSAVAWDGRKWHVRTEIWENLVDIEIRVCLSL